MSKFYRYINEQKIRMTIKDIESLERKAIGDMKRNIEFLIDYWYEGNKKEVTELLQMFSKAINIAIGFINKKTSKKVYYEKNQIIRQFFDFESFPTKIEDLFPVIIYVSAHPNDENTIGLLVDKNGNIKEFEGNEEASNETYNLIDDILETSDKKITVFGNHSENIVKKIRKTKTLPKNLYMSPYKNYAEGYWSMEENRILFSCKAKKSDFIRESEYDWRTKTDTRISDLKIL